LRLAFGLLTAGGVYLASQPGPLSLEALAEFDTASGARESPLDPNDFEVARWSDRANSLIVVRRTEPIRNRRRSKSRAP